MIVVLGYVCELRLAGFKERELYALGAAGSTALLPVAASRDERQ
jgi:hypothetical protein